MNNHPRALESTPIAHGTWIATGLPLSTWLFAFLGYLLLSFAAIKRQTEGIDRAKRNALEANRPGYKVNKRPIISLIAVGVGSICVPLNWINGIIMTAHRGNMQDEPVIYTAQDWISQIVMLVILGFVLIEVWA